MYRHTQFTCNFQVLYVKAYWSVNKWYINISLFRLILQIYSSEWVLFTVIIFLKKKLCGPFLWIGSNCLKATEPLRGGTLLFTTKLPSILSFPKNLLPTIFQFSRIDSKFWCDVLRDLVPFLQFKKREKHLWRSVTFGLLKVTLLYGCFSRFLDCIDGTK